MIASQQMTSEHMNGLRVSRVTARRGADHAELQRSCQHALSRGASRLEVDLTAADTVDAGLLTCLVTIARSAREHHASVKLTPSLALDRWLEACRLDHRLKPLRG